jgi:hypothetical protein
MSYDRPLFKNRYGEFPSGTRVYFGMENPSLWSGGNTGVLTFEEEKWVIKSDRAGTIGIDGYLEAYGGSIYPEDPSLMRARQATAAEGAKPRRNLISIDEGDEEL